MQLPRDWMPGRDSLSHLHDMYSVQAVGAPLAVETPLVAQLAIWMRPTLQRQDECICLLRGVVQAQEAWPARYFEATENKLSQVLFCKGLLATSLAWPRAQAGLQQVCRTCRGRGQSGGTSLLAPTSSYLALTSSRQASSLVRSCTDLQGQMRGSYDVSRWLVS